MAKLILGPMLRFLDANAATVWVETDAPCEVEVLGHRARTFHVAGHHYGLVAVTGLEPDSSTEYQVLLDGERRWPEPGSQFPASRIQTLPETGRIEIVWGSCRVTAPQDAPYAFDEEQDARGVGVDALYALALRLLEQDPARWPRLLLLIGDQVYADQVSPQALEFIRRRRDTDQEPGEEVIDFAEYTMLYREGWSEPALRWLFSSVSSAMIFDDHDVHDDWNTSESWVQDMRAHDWWPERINAALSTYWIYQHIGNLTPAELAADELYARVLAAEDADQILRDFALTAEQEGGGSLWSFSRRLAGTRLVVVDGREGRVLEGGRREMMDESEWGWVEDQLTGDYDHVLLVSTLPILLAPTLHYLEAWNEAVCSGAWGRLAAKWAEKLRRALDLEHWAAFQSSFTRLIDLVTQVACGDRGRAPATIVMLGGDVHQAYLETVGFNRALPVRSAVYQAVCSPFRHQLAKRQRRILAVARRSRLLGWLARRLAHGAGVEDPTVRWQAVQPPTWRNQLGWLVLDGRRLELTIETTRPGPEPALEVSLRHQLA
ncbi:MAG: alkaline phosphatase family protein [Actinomycetota bacterium]|nr:alkaline phosphatase family protein [Actinomycetota bacterium]